MHDSKTGIKPLVCTAHPTKVSEFDLLKGDILVPKLQNIHSLFIAGLLTFFLVQTVAAKPLLEINTKSQTHVGREITHSEHRCWLMKRDGKLIAFPFSDVKSFKKVAQRFKPYSAAEMRSQLTLEFGREFEVIGTTHYLICAAPGHGKKYGELFEQLYRECHVYFSTRGFQVKSLEFPLVAIIFPTQAPFVKYAHSDKITKTTHLAGYYQLQTNRIAIFDPSTSSKTAANEDRTSPAISFSPDHQIVAKAGSMNSSLQDTIMHEATHQVAFNLGLHSRIGKTPLWVIEGLAMVFEHPDSRKAAQSSDRAQRLNRERYLWFGNYVKKRRNKRALEEFLSHDQLFKKQTLDAYSEAWSLSFFLMETRSSQYTKYLKRITDRPMLSDYSAQERLKDFHDCFGTRNKMEMFEAEYVRFIQRLQ